MEPNSRDRVDPEASTAAARDSAGETTIMGTYDCINDQPKFIIADITCDDAWIATAVDSELILSKWQ